MGENRKENKQKKDKGKKANEKQGIILDVVFLTSLILAGSFCLASAFEHRHMFELAAASMFFGTVAFLTWMLMGT